MTGKKIKLIALGLVVCFALGGCTEKGGNSSTLDDDTVEKHDVIVIGGGIAGLTSGYYLRNEDVLVLEKKGAVGGRTISAMNKSFTYAKGTEYLGTPENPLTQMINELNLEPKEIPSPMDAYFDGDSFYYGTDGIRRYLINNSSMEDYMNFTSLLSDEYDIYDEIPDIEYNEVAEKLDYLSASQWLRKNGIPDVFVKKYNVSSKGLFGANMEEISALSFIPEAAYDYEGEVNEKLSTEDYLNYNEEDLEQEYADAKNEKSGSYSFEKGLTELTDELGKVLGEKVRLNSTVISVKKTDKGYNVIYMDGDKKEHSIFTNKVVLAVPAPEALKIASSVLSKERKELMETVEYSSYATVALFSETPIFNKAFDLAVPDEYYFTDVYDATWVERAYNKEKQNAKEYIASVYVAPKSGKDHTLDSISDEELLKNIYADLDRIFPNASSKVTGYDIEKFPYAYPIMSTGAYKRLLSLDRLNHGSLILAGDYMVYPTFEAAVQSGHLAAKRILEMKDK